MSDTTLDTILVDTLKTNGFADILAHNIAAQYGEKLMDEFGNQITKALGNYVEKTVEQYVKDWELDSNIKRRVGAVFRTIDKVELLEALKEKDWRDL
jgi:Ni,Fe-hydrogenase I small subunit